MYGISVHIQPRYFYLIFSRVGANNTGQGQISLQQCLKIKSRQDYFFLKYLSQSGKRD